MLFFHRSIGLKILGPIGLLILLGLLGLVTFYANQQSRAIWNQHRQLLEQLADHITRGLKTVMLAGYADIAQDYADSMKNSQGFKSVRILRITGEEAFLDNSTLAKVNARLGREEFLTKKNPQRHVVLPGEDAHLQQVLQDKAMTSFLGPTPEGEAIHYLIPIVNEKRCHRCHSSDHEVRGVLLLSADIAPIQQVIADSQYRAYRIVAVSLLVALAALFVMVRHTVVAPIRRVTAAMMQVVGGNYEQQVPVPGQDEVAMMAQSFNSMTHRLAETYTGLEREIGLRRDAETRMADYARKLEQLVQERTRQLVHADRLASLGTFAAGMAHEINNPNAFIQGNIQFLKKFWELAQPIVERHSDEDASGRLKAFHGQVVETLDGVLDGSQRIARIVDSLKTYSKSGDNMDKVVCRVADPVQDAINLLRYRLKRGTTTEVKIPPHLTVWCDRQQMCQVFVNLMANALDAMDDAGLTENRRIGIRSEEMDDHIWIWVEDNGPGIPATAAGRIFDPFYTTKGKTKGTGLGLAIVQGIVEEHGGHITVFSAPGSQTEFLVILPSLALSRQRQASAS